MPQPEPRYEVIPVPIRHMPADVRDRFYAKRLSEDPDGLVEMDGSTALVRKVEFDSECFGVSIGRVVVARFTTAGVDGLVRAITRRASDLGIRHLSIRLPAKAVPVVQALEKHGFYLADTHVAMVHPLKEPLEVVLRGFTLSDSVPEEDILALAYASKEAFVHSRYYNDPWLSADGAKTLYTRWAVNNMRERSDTLFAAMLDGRAIAFLANMWQEAEPDIDVPGIVSMDLLAVLPAAQGKGVAKALIRSVINHYRTKTDQLHVETQGANVPAIHLYETLGFGFADQDLTFHWHAPN